MNDRALATSALLVIAGVAAAGAIGLLAQDAIGLGPVGVAVAVVVVLGLAVAIWLPEGLAAFGVAVLLSESLTYWTGLDSRYVDEAGLPMLAIVVMTVHRRRVSFGSPGIAELGLLLLILSGIASSLRNDVPASIWIPGLALLAKGAAVFYLVRSVALDAAEVRRLAVPVLVVGLVITAIGLIQFVSPGWAAEALQLPPTGQPRGSITVAGSVFTHPAVYGWLTAFISIFLYARFAVMRDRAALLLGLVANVGTLLSGRRAPLIGVVVALVLGGVRQWTAGHRLGRSWAIVSVAVVALMAASIPILGEFYARSLERYGAPPDVIGEVLSDQPDPQVIAQLQPRVALLVASIAIARDEFPLGGGIGRFGSHMSRVSYSPLYAEYGLDRTHGLRESNPRAVTDTFWPMILGEAGVLGLVGAALFVGGLGMRLWRAAARDASPEVRAFILGGLLVFGEGVVRSLVSPALVAPPVAHFVFGAAALALGLDGRARQVEAEQVK